MNFCLSACSAILLVMMLDSYPTPPARSSDRSAYVGVQITRTNSEWIMGFFHELEPVVSQAEAVAEFSTGHVSILLGKGKSAFRPSRYFSVPGA